MTTVTTCPGFIDLRAFAGTECASVADPFGTGRKVLPLRGDDVEMGTIHLMPGTGTQAMTGGDTFLIVAQGAVEMTATRQGDTATWDLQDSGCCVVSDGSDLAWTTRVPTILIYMRHTAGKGHDNAGTFINPYAAMTPSAPPLAELLVGPTPACHNATQFLSTDGEFMCGTWDGTPYHRLSMAYRHFELMYLLAGTVTFVDEAGHTGTFTKGDIFMIEQHAHCSWDSQVDVAKVYAIFRPKV